MLKPIDRRQAQELHPQAFAERQVSGRPEVAEDETSFFLTEDGSLVASVPWGKAPPLRYVFRHWTTQCPPSWVGDHDGSVQHLWDEVRIKPGPKWIRCTCIRCGKVNYHPAATTDTTEPHLCQKCDDDLIAWQNAAAAGPEEGRRTLEAFLARRPQR